MSMGADDLTGKVIASQFQVDRKLGQGGMGAVYLAEQLEMGRKVVLKVMHPSLLGSSAGPVIEERFKREARMVAQLNHPNVVQVYVFGRTDDQQLYMAMEYIEGGNLRELMFDRRPLPEARALRILDQILSALIEAHDLGLVHRDLKPENIMLTDRHGNPDYVKVLDFGIAKMRSERDVRLTQTGAVFGTAQYMAPEQARAQAVDQRTDIYALGVILYEMLSGQLPFAADSVFEYMLKQVSAPIEMPTRRFPGLVILPRTEAIIGRALEKDPALRFQSASEMQREVRLSLGDRPDAGKPFPTPPVPHHPGAAAGFSAGGTAVLPPTGGTAAPPPRAVTEAPARTPVHADAGVTDDAAARASEPSRSSRKLLVGVALLVVVAGGAYAILGRGRPLGPSGVYLPSGARMIEGLPVPEGAEVDTSTPQVLMLRTERDPHAIVDFYRQQAGAWGPVRETANTLQFTDERAPISFVTVTRTGDRLQVSLVRSVFVKPVVEPPPAEVFGAPLPPDAQRSVLTTTAAMYNVPRSTKDVIAFYRHQLSDASDLQITEATNNAGSFLVVTAQNPTRKFANISVMTTPDQLKPKAGLWTQITVTARTDGK